jgi:hypothetical protein
MDFSATTNEKGATNGKTSAAERDLSGNGNIALKILASE